MIRIRAVNGDVIQSMGQTGLGSIDVVLPADLPFIDENGNVTADGITLTLEDLPGAGGLLALNQVATAPPDGLREAAAGIGADDMHAEDAVRRVFSKNLDEAFGGAVDLGAAIGGERELT